MYTNYQRKVLINNLKFHNKQININYKLIRTINIVLITNIIHNY